MLVPIAQQRGELRVTLDRLIPKSVGTEFADQMTDDHDAMGLEVLCKPDPVIGWAIPRVSQLVRAIQLAERRSTHLAAARSYPVAAGDVAALRQADTLVRQVAVEAAIDDEAGAIHVPGFVIDGHRQRMPLRRCPSEPTSPAGDGTADGVRYPSRPPFWSERRARLCPVIL